MLDMFLYSVCQHTINLEPNKCGTSFTYVYPANKTPNMSNKILFMNFLVFFYMFVMLSFYNFF